MRTARLVMVLGMCASACGGDDDDPPPPVIGLAVVTTTGTEATDADISLCYFRFDRQERECHLLDVSDRDDFQAAAVDSFVVPLHDPIEVESYGDLPGFTQVELVNEPTNIIFPVPDDWGLTAFSLTLRLGDRSEILLCDEIDVDVTVTQTGLYLPPSCP
jgi:hypothetical protein